MVPDLLLAEAISGYAAPGGLAVTGPSSLPHLHDHAVNLYDDDVDLIEAVALHVLDGGLTLGQRIVVVATPEHRAAIDEALTAGGADIAQMKRAGDYLCLDAAETLSRFMVNGAPDPELFHATAKQALGDPGGHGRPARVYGEMVALLWDEGNVSAALQLESLWNALAEDLDFSLLCGYPMRALERHGDLADVRDVCHLHTGLVPPRRYRAHLQDTLPLGDVLSRSEVFLSVPEAVGGVRRWLSATLRHWGEGQLIDATNVVASELATNAIRHARSPFRVTLTRVPVDDGRVVRLSVEDMSQAQPALNARDTEELGGRGVHLVAQLADRWGVDPRPGGKTVWAQFRATTG